MFLTKRPFLVSLTLGWLPRIRPLKYPYFNGELIDELDLVFVDLVSFNIIYTYIIIYIVYFLG